MVARAVRDGRVINEVPLRYAGEKSTFAGRVPLPTAGPIELEVLAMDRSLSTTRRLWSTGGVSSCYHAATGTPRTRSIQEHHRSVQIVGFLWGQVLLGLLRWCLGIIRNQQVRSSTLLAGSRRSFPVSPYNLSYQLAHLNGQSLRPHQRDEAIGFLDCGFNRGRQVCRFGTHLADICFDGGNAGGIQIEAQVA